MRKRYFTQTVCTLICTSLLTGCGAFDKLDNPYVFSERSSLYESGELEDEAPLFAENLCVIGPDTPEQTASPLTSEAAALFDVSNQKALFSKNPYERLYPASITKIMTALLALKYGNESDLVTVTSETVITESGATLCGINPGDKLTVEQLLYGLMLPSGNDAAAAIAVHMDGSIEAFAERMNREAQSLGATGTHFVNPHGLNDVNHYTTAYDLYLIFNEALKYPEFEKIIGTTSYNAVYTNAVGETVEKTWKGTNQFMTGERKPPGDLTVLGGKTGTTKAAGNCLIMESQDGEGNKYISVVLKAAGRPALYDSMENILNNITD